MMCAKKAAPIAGAAMILASAAASAESLDFSLSDDAFRFGLLGSLSRLISGAQGQYDVGYLQHRGDGNDAYAVHAGVLFTGDAGLRDLDLTAGVGLRGVFVGGDGDDGGAVAPGLQLDLRLPGYERIGLLGYGYYAPGVVSFNEIDSYRDVGLVLSYQINHNASVFAGYRNVRIGIDHGPNATLDNGFYGGIGLTF
jgi:hypothetical protein